VAQPGALMAAEIHEQPAVLQRILDESARDVTEVAAAIRRADPRFVLLVARGTSDHAALYAKYLIETTLHLPAGLVSTSTYTAYQESPQLDGVLWISVSQSGGSPDLAESTSRARGAGALTLAVTNVPGSPLNETCELSLDMRAGAERSVAATKTYTASLLTLFLLVEAWRDVGLDAGQQVPQLASRALDLPQVAEVASRYRFVDKLVTTSRGYAYPTAREGALKLMETCYLAAHAFSGADLLHGPLAMRTGRSSSSCPRAAAAMRFSRSSSGSWSAAPTCASSARFRRREPRCTSRSPAGWTSGSRPSSRSSPSSSSPGRWRSPGATIPTTRAVSQR
jgi:glucosamine--fructose-6-phosphate aminotransferase (isomerizing)